MMVEERLPSLLREDGLRNNDLMVWLGVIRTLLEVEAVVRVGYRGIRVCLEEVDLTILGGEENVNKIESRDVFDIAPHIVVRLTPNRPLKLSSSQQNQLGKYQRDRKLITTIHEG